MKDVVKKLHPLERKVLPFLDKCSSDEELVDKTCLKEVEVTRALQWLSNKGVVKLKKSEEEVVSLGPNGEIYSEKGLPERRFLKALEKEDELLLEEVKSKGRLDQEEVTASLGKLKRKGFIDIEKKEDELFVRITEDGRKSLFDEAPAEKFLNKKFPVYASSLSKDEKEVLNALKDRKGILESGREKTLKYEVTKKGEKLLKEDIGDSDLIESVTSDVLKNKTWKKKDFREYDVSVNVPKVSYGKKHFVNEAIEYIKQIWLEMGFEEMMGDMVQTGFWNLDSLFVPQDHPARELQDTFYLEEPSHGKVDKDFYKKVKGVHEDGGDTGSKGWQYEYDKDTAERLMLRTHTTVLSAQTISKLKEGDLPAKYFSVGRNFRNESLDWKHLFEFFQVEGIVVDPDANFRNLLGYLKEFFGKMGFPDVRIRPGHFPYTEPSAEVDVYHPERDEWIELGGSGIFRPEVTKPLIGEEVPVLAWGLGMERIISDYYDITDIRDIYRNDLELLRGVKKFTK